MTDEIFYPTSNLLEIDSQKQEQISKDLTNFLQKEELLSEISNGSKIVASSYNMIGKPSLRISPSLQETDSTEEIKTHTIFMSNGKKKYIIMERSSQGKVAIIEHNFDEGYQNCICDWFRSIYNSIEYAKSKNQFEWLIQK